MVSHALSAGWLKKQSYCLGSNKNHAEAVQVFRWMWHSTHPGVFIFFLAFFIYKPAKFGSQLVLYFT